MALVGFTEAAGGADRAITAIDLTAAAVADDAALRAGKDAKIQILEIVAQEYKLDVNDLDIVAEQVINRKDSSKMMNFDKALELCYSPTYPTAILDSQFPGPMWRQSSNALQAQNCYMETRFLE